MQSGRLLQVFFEARKKSGLGVDWHDCYISHPEFLTGQPVNSSEVTADDLTAHDVFIVQQELSSKHWSCQVSLYVQNEDHRFVPISQRFYSAEGFLLYAVGTR